MSNKTIISLTSIGALALLIGYVYPISAHETESSGNTLQR